MAIFVLGDPHLSFGSAKPMDVFTGWGNHARRIEENWRRNVRAGDTVVLPGDISWAMTLEQALPDFQFLHALPGTKVIMKGNHDYWWNTRTKVEAFWRSHGLDSLVMLYNNAVLAEGIALCGSRGWFFDCEEAEDRKVLAREAGRLRASICAGKKLSAKLCVFLHYPPITSNRRCGEILGVLTDEGVRCCYYGHLHGSAISWAFKGKAEGISFECVSADALHFTPKKIDAALCAAGCSVSLILPVNDTEALRRAATSLRAQTRADWELILVNAAPTGECATACDALAAQDDRIHVLYQEQGKPAEAVIAATATSKGEFVGFLREEASLPPAYLSKLMRAAHTAGTPPVDLVYAGEAEREISGGSLRQLAADLKQNRSFFAPARIIFRRGLLTAEVLGCAEDMAAEVDAALVLAVYGAAARIREAACALPRESRGNTDLTSLIQLHRARLLFMQKIIGDDPVLLAQGYQNYADSLYAYELPALLRNAPYPACKTVLRSELTHFALQHSPPRFKTAPRGYWLAKRRCYYAAWLLLKNG